MKNVKFNFAECEMVSPAEMTGRIFENGAVEYQAEVSKGDGKLYLVTWQFDKEYFDEIMEEFSADESALDWENENYIAEIDEIAA